jgi:hypothetical protein
MRRIAPSKPRKTPPVFFRIKGAPKKSMPRMSVNSGVREFKIPAIVLLICVCAKAKRKEGRALPVTPTNKKYRHFFQSIRLNRAARKGIKARAEMLIRKQATCSGEKAIKLFFIKIKELPQIMLSTTRINQLFAVSERGKLERVKG